MLMGYRANIVKSLFGSFSTRKRTEIPKNIPDFTISVVEKRNGKPDNRLRVMGRNLEPEKICKKCGKQPASLIDVFDESWFEGWYCEACADSLADDEETEEAYFLPKVNSPRVGVCAYEGPFEEDPYKV